MTTDLVFIGGSDAVLADWQSCAASWLERKRSRSGSERTATGIVKLSCKLDEEIWEPTTKAKIRL